MTRVPNALRDCANLPPLQTSTWTERHGISGVIARFQSPASIIEPVSSVTWPDHFTDDTFPVFVSRHEPLGISHSWGNAPDATWVPGAGSTPPFAVFRAAAVPAVAITLTGLSRPADAVLMADDGRRWAVPLPAGDSTVEVPEDAREGCISLQLDDQGGLTIETLALNTELDIRALDRAVDVYLLPELASDNAGRRMAASRILSSGGPGTDELLIEAILDATDAVQAEIIDVLARRSDGLSTLLDAYPELELSSAALDRLGRSLAQDTPVATRYLDMLSQLSSGVRSEVLRALAWSETHSPQVTALLCDALNDPISADDAVVSLGGQSAAAIPAMVECAANAATTDVRIRALRATLRAVRRHADEPDRHVWLGQVETLATSSIADTNGSVSRLGIGLCTHLATEACLSVLPELSTSDPDPQLRADAWVARIASGEHEAALVGLQDSSPTVRLAIAHQLLRRRIRLEPIEEIERLMINETWPSATRLLATWLIYTDQSTPDFLAATAGRLGGADGASLARQMSTAGIFPSCEVLFGLMPVDATAGTPLGSPDFVDGVLSLVASCSDYDDTDDPLRRYLPMASSEPRAATAFLQAAAAQQRPWALEALDSLIRAEPELHLAALRALSWFDDATQRRYIDEFAGTETDERALRIFELLESRQ